MDRQYTKIVTSDGETRWLNLNHISRVTLATDANRAQMLVIFFHDMQPDAALKIHGTDETNLQAINTVIDALDRRSFHSVAPLPA